MNKEERTILIEQYLDGELRGDDLRKFEWQLQNDKEFAQDYYLQKEIRVALTNRDIIDLREKLNDIREDFEKEKPFARKRKPVLLYAFCTIIIIFVISTICILEKPYTNDELYEKYYEHYDAGIRTRGVVETTTDIFIQALREYDNQEYSEALELFNQITDTAQFFVPKEYFTGLSYMGLKKFDEAIRHFDNVSSDKQSVYYENAIWYTGLCYLKKNQANQAIQQFRKLLNKDSYLHKRASEILEKMK